MNKDRIAGAVQQAKGTLKMAVGKVLGDAKLQADGQSDKAAGKLLNVVGGLKDVAKE